MLRAPSSLAAADEIVHVHAGAARRAARQPATTPVAPPELPEVVVVLAARRQQRRERDGAGADPSSTQEFPARKRFVEHPIELPTVA